MGILNNLSPKGALCPRYHYCPVGSANPIPCPDGTTNYGEGSGAIEDCVACERGRFCRFATYFSKVNFLTIDFNLLALKAGIYAGVTDFGPCSAGYICKSGSNTSTPTDEDMGYICPTGHYCLAGALVENQCSIGTY